MELRASTLDRQFDLRLASKLTGLGYEIETSFKADGHSGGRKYSSWDIKGIPDSVIRNFSRRTREVEEAEKKIVAKAKQADPRRAGPAVGRRRDKLGATSRRHKREDLTLDDYREYWNARITAAEGRQIADTISRARKGLNAKPANTVDKAMQYAIEHHFYRHSVYGHKPLLITAMERAMGAALPEDVAKEAEHKACCKARSGGMARSCRALPRPRQSSPRKTALPASRSTGGAVSSRSAPPRGRA